MKPTFALTLHGDAVIGGMPLDVTKRFAGWTRSIYRIGGFWQGTAQYNLTEGDEYEMRDLFINGLGRRVTEEIGGDVTWEGFLGEMDMVLDGQRWSRSLIDCANAVQIAYTRTSENLFVNPSVETDPWTPETAGDPPPVIERTEDWSVIGDWSMHCETGVSNTQGMQVGMVNDMQQITIEPEMGYQVSVSVRIDGADDVWVLKVKEQNSGNDVTIAKAKSIGTGEQILCAEISSDNLFTLVRIIHIQRPFTNHTTGK